MKTPEANEKPAAATEESEANDRVHRDDLAMVTGADICSRFQVSKRTLQKWRKEGKFPEPDLVIGTTVRWLVTTVEAWIDENRRRRGVAKPARQDGASTLLAGSDLNEDV